jgi:hypothetical protein
VGGEEWQEKVYDREEWKRLLRTARNHRILHTPMDWLIDNGQETSLIYCTPVLDISNPYLGVLPAFPKAKKDLFGVSMNNMRKKYNMLM